MHVHLSEVDFGKSLHLEAKMGFIRVCWYIPWRCIMLPRFPIKIPPCSAEMADRKLNINSLWDAATVGWNRCLNILFWITVSEIVKYIFPYYQDITIYIYIHLGMHNKEVIPITYKVLIHSSITLHSYTAHITHAGGYFSYNTVSFK